MITNINDFKNSLITEHKIDGKHGDSIRLNTLPMYAVNVKWVTGRSVNGVEKPDAWTWEVYVNGFTEHYNTGYYDNPIDAAKEAIRTLGGNSNVKDFKNGQFIYESIENNINEAKTKDYFIVVKGDDVEFSTTDLKEAKAKFKSYPKPTRPSQEVSLYKLIAQTSI